MKEQRKIRALSEAFLESQGFGVEAAMAEIQKRLDEPAKVVPFKMPDDYFLTTVNRDGEEVKVQVEIDEHEWHNEASNEPLAEQEEGWETEVVLGKVYTADAQMLDVVLTREERERITAEYCASRE